MERLNPKIVALYTHWCTANSAKQFLLSDIPEAMEEIPEQINIAGIMHDMSLRICVWYALIYVVVEGFIQLKLSHPKVDKILKNKDYVNSLRRFRNGIFHYQEKPMGKKILEFLETKDSENWINALNEALEKFFIENLPIKKTLEELHQIYLTERDKG